MNPSMSSDLLNTKANRASPASCALWGCRKPSMKRAVDLGVTTDLGSCRRPCGFHSSPGHGTTRTPLGFIGGPIGEPRCSHGKSPLNRCHHRIEPQRPPDDVGRDGEEDAGGRRAQSGYDGAGERGMGTCRSKSGLKGRLRPPREPMKGLLPLKQTPMFVSTTPATWTRPVAREPERSRGHSPGQAMATQTQGARPHVQAARRLRANRQEMARHRAHGAGRPQAMAVRPVVRCPRARPCCRPAGRWAGPCG